MKTRMGKRGVEAFNLRLALAVLSPQDHESGKRRTQNLPVAEFDDGGKSPVWLSGDLDNFQGDAGREPSCCDAIVSDRDAVYFWFLPV